MHLQRISITGIKWRDIVVKESKVLIFNYEK